MAVTILDHKQNLLLHF